MSTQPATPKRCCPEDRKAVVVTMRPSPADAWFVSGGVTIQYKCRLPDGKFQFHLQSEGSSSPEVATLRVKDRIPLPEQATLQLLRCNGTRVMLAICYPEGNTAIRAKSRGSSLVARAMGDVQMN
jgi:hypothetical protein